jgi:hypothetical protein
LDDRDIEWIKSLRDSDPRVIKGIREAAKKWAEEISEKFDRRWQERLNGQRK